MPHVFIIHDQIMTTNNKPTDTYSVTLLIPSDSHCLTRAIYMRLK